MYPNYLKGLEDYSKAEVSLYKLMGNDGKAKVNSP